MKKRAKQLQLHILILILAPILGLLALIAVHLIPTDSIREHVYWSLDMIEQEFADESLITGYPSTMTGSFTDCLMLHHAIYTNESHSILDQTLRMFRSETNPAQTNADNWWPGQSLKDYLEGVEQEREVEYPRYWHGYLVILKPLLFLTSFNSIRLLNSALQLLLIGSIVLAFSRKKIYAGAMAYLFSLPFMFFVSTYASLSLSICFYLMNLAVLFQLKKDHQLFSGRKYGIFFLIIGICTAYFDFLTYPIITLVYPLCIYFIFHRETVKSDFSKMVVYSLEWGIGYAYMWASKWVLTDALLGTHVISDALNTVAFRSQSVDNVSRIEGFINALSLHIQPFTNWGFVLFTLLFVVGAIIKALSAGFCISLTQFSKGIIFFVIAMFPFIWIFFIQNHSIFHWQFTCRILSATVFSVVIAINTLVECSTKKGIDG